MNLGLVYSVCLHSIVILLLWIDVPSFFHEEPKITQAPIIVDLEKVEISEFTNLPEFIDEEELGTKEAKGSFNPPSIPKSKPIPPAKTQQKSDGKPSGFELEEAKIKIEKQEKKPQKKEAKKEPKEKSKEKDESGEKLKKDKEVKPVPKPKKKPEKIIKDNRETLAPTKGKEGGKAQKGSKQGNKNQKIGGISSLLASVGNLEKSLPKRKYKNKGGNKGKIGEDGGISGLKTRGIKGGIGGRYDRALTISEKDALSARLRRCWNLDAGARGIKDMVIELRAFLNKDGTVRKVDILNKRRYKKDSFYRSVTESAVRAVHLCAPYSAFPEKYKNQYELWSTMLLRFNPYDGGVF